MRVLLVDDEPDVLAFLAEAVSQCGCPVRIAPTAERALGLLAHEPADLVISDIRLPSLSGLDLLDAVTRRWPATRVALLTGAPSIESATFGIRRHASDYLTKPVSMDELAALVRRIGDERARTSGATTGHGISGGPQRVEGLVRLAQVALTRPEPAGVLDELTEQGCRSLHGDAALALLRDADGHVTVRAKGDGGVIDALPLLVRAAWPALLATRTHEALSIGPPDGPIAALGLRIPVGPASLILAVGRDARRGGFVPDERRFLSASARVAALALERLLLGEAVEQRLLDVVGTLVRALEAKDPALHGHGARVSLYAAEIGGRLGLRPPQLAVTRRAAVLHDLGKLTVFDGIWRQRQPLTPAQYRLVQRHPVAAEAILRAFPLLAEEATVIRHHAERHDGRGYPDGRQGPAIPLPSRIIAVADAFDAMTSVRAYRPARPLDVAREEIVRQAGAQFDPAVVEAFVAIPPGRLAEVSAFYRRVQAGCVA